MSFAEMEKPAGGTGCFFFLLQWKERQGEDKFCFVYFKFDMSIRNPIEILSGHISEV